MIYRLSTGAQSDLKKWLGSIGLILGLTIGFPLLAAWANHENLTLRPTNVAQTGAKGTVLGESTGNGGSNDSSSSSNSSATLPMGSVPASKPLVIAPRRTTKPAVEAPVPVTTEPVTTTTPAASATVDPSPTTGGGGTTIGVDVLDTVDGTVHVDPPAVDVNLGL